MVLYHRAAWPARRVRTRTRSGGTSWKRQLESDSFVELNLVYSVPEGNGSCRIDQDQLATAADGGVRDLVSAQENAGHRNHGGWGRAECRGIESGVIGVCVCVGARARVCRRTDEYNQELGGIEDLQVQKAEAIKWSNVSNRSNDN